MARNVNLYVDKGASFETFIELSDDNIDLTADYDTFVGRMKKHFESANTVTISVAAVNSSALRLYMEANTTGNLDSDRYIYNVELVNGDDVIRLTQGLVFVNLRA